MGCFQSPFFFFKTAAIALLKVVCLASSLRPPDNRRSVTAAGYLPGVAPKGTELPTLLGVYIELLH